MPKFFVPPEKIADGKITIDTADVKHITKVLRYNTGDVINVCDTSGYDYTAEIAVITDGAVTCKILSGKKSDTESNIRVTLYQGLPKGTKMEYIIEKTTELGIYRIVPVIMNRCVMKIENEKSAQKKQERWQKIAESAAKQSGRGIIPEVGMPITFRQAAEEMKNSDLALLPYELEQNTGLKSVLKKSEKHNDISIMIGPEGGFDKEEIHCADDMGLTCVTLGKRILRTETAGEAVLSMIMYEFDEIL